MRILDCWLYAPPQFYKISWINLKFELQKFLSSKKFHENGWSVYANVEIQIAKGLLEAHQQNLGLQKFLAIIYELK